MRVIFDTVIFVRALMNPLGRWGRLVFTYDAQYHLVVSPPVLTETLEVLHRPELTRKYRGVAGLDLDAVVAALRAAEVVPIPPSPVISRDPKDDTFLATAKAGGAAYIVSEDHDLLVLGKYDGIRIVNTATFLAILEGEDSGSASPGQAPDQGRSP